MADIRRPEDCYDVITVLWNKSLWKVVFNSSSSRCMDDCAL